MVAVHRPAHAWRPAISGGCLGWDLWLGWVLPSKDCVKGLTSEEKQQNFVFRSRFGLQFLSHQWLVFVSRLHFRRKHDGDLHMRRDILSAKFSHEGRALESLDHPINTTSVFHHWIRRFVFPVHQNQSSSLLSSIVHRRSSRYVSS